MAKQKTKKLEAAKALARHMKEMKRKPVVTRGRTFEGKVIKKFPKRIAIEFERTVYIHKFERFMKKKTRIHARLPDEFADKVHVGDFVRIKECRPLSKIIHFIFIQKIMSVGEKGEKMNNSKQEAAA